MTHPAQLDCSVHRPAQSDPVPLSHLLTCDECAGLMVKRALEANPGIRTDLFPGDDCPDDQTLAVLARERTCGAVGDHIRQCLWCTLSLRHFFGSPEAVPASAHVLPSRHRHFLLEKLQECRSRPLPPSAEMDYHESYVSVRSPLERRTRNEPLVADLPVRTLIVNLIVRQQLPVTAPDGSPMSYSLMWKEGDRRLKENETLRGAGVTPGDHIYLVPEYAVEPPKE